MYICPECECTIEDYSIDEDDYIFMNQDNQPVNAVINGTYRNGTLFINKNNFKITNRLKVIPDRICTNNSRLTIRQEGLITEYNIGSGIRFNIDSILTTI